MAQAELQGPLLMDAATFLGSGAGGKVPTRTVVVSLNAGAPVSWRIPFDLAITCVAGSANTFVSRDGRTTNTAGTVNGGAGGYIIETTSGGLVTTLYEVCRKDDLIWFYNLGVAVNPVIFEPLG